MRKIHGQRASSVCVNTKNERNLLWQKSVAIHPATNQAVKAVPARKIPTEHAGSNECNVKCKSNVIGIVSGKGGVGKSFVTASLANRMAKKGYKVGILDADITGPSIPKMYGLKGPANVDDKGVYPAVAANGVKVMSINLLLPGEEEPVIWRGPVIAGTVKQFWTDVIWGDLDYLFVDMPPGTGDVPLTVFQSLPVDGVVIVSSPQDLVRMIVMKAYKMAQMMSVPCSVS